MFFNRTGHRDAECVDGEERGLLPPQSTIGGLGQGSVVALLARSEVEPQPKMKTILVHFTRKPPLVNRVIKC